MGPSCASFQASSLTPWFPPSFPEKTEASEIPCGAQSRGYPLHGVHGVHDLWFLLINQIINHCYHLWGALYALPTCIISPSETSHLCKHSRKFHPSYG